MAVKGNVIVHEAVGGNIVARVQPDDPEYDFSRAKVCLGNLILDRHVVIAEGWYVVATGDVFGKGLST